MHNFPKTAWVISDVVFVAFSVSCENLSLQFCLWELFASIVPIQFYLEFYQDPIPIQWNCKLTKTTESMRKMSFLEISIENHTRREQGTNIHRRKVMVKIK